MHGHACAACIPRCAHLQSLARVGGAGSRCARLNGPKGWFAHAIPSVSGTASGAIAANNPPRNTLATLLSRSDLVTSCYWNCGNTEMCETTTSFDNRTVMHSTPNCRPIQRLHRTWEAALAATLTADVLVVFRGTPRSRKQASCRDTPIW